MLALKLTMRQTATVASNILGQWRAICSRPGEPPVQGLHQWNWSAQHRKRLPHGSSPSKQTQRRVKHTHDTAKKYFLVGTISLWTGTHICSIPYKIQQQLFSPAPLIAYPDAIVTQGHNTSNGSLREIHFLLRC